MEKSLIFGFLLFVELQICTFIAGREVDTGGGKCKKTEKCTRGTMNAIADFEESLNCTTYVDKTMLIHEYFHNSGSRRCSLITCPHKFGKSTNLDMMRRFVQGGVKLSLKKYQLTSEKEIDQNNQNIFLSSGRKLKITAVLKDTEDFYKDNFQKYSTIHVSFKVNGVKTHKELIAALWENFRRCFYQHKALYYNFKKYYSELWSLYWRDPMIEELRRSAEIMDRAFIDGGPFETDVADGLYQLYRLLCRFYPYSKLFLFVDDYDDPIIQAIENNLDVTLVARLMDKIFTTLFDRNNRNIYHVLITGTLNIIDINKFSFIDHNNFLDSPLSKYFGLTEDEVDELLDRHRVNGMDKNIVKRYYDGYNVSRSSTFIYNPYSIASYLCSIESKSTTVGLRNYWGENCPISNFWRVFKRNETYQELACSLLALKKVKFSLIEHWSNEDLEELRSLIHDKNIPLTSYRVNLTLSYLFHHGYLSFSDDVNVYRMPNNEDIKSCLLKSPCANHNFMVLNKSKLKAKLSPIFSRFQ